MDFSKHEKLKKKHQNLSFLNKIFHNNFLISHFSFFKYDSEIEGFAISVIRVILTLFVGNGIFSEYKTDRVFWKVIIRIYRKNVSFFTITSSFT